MNRREFLNRMVSAGLVVAAPKIIFDLGANKFRSEPGYNIGATDEVFNELYVEDIAYRFDERFSPEALKILEQYYYKIREHPDAIHPVKGFYQLKTNVSQ